MCIRERRETVRRERERERERERARERAWLGRLPGVRYSSVPKVKIIFKMSLLFHIKPQFFKKLF